MRETPSPIILHPQGSHHLCDPPDLLSISTARISLALKCNTIPIQLHIHDAFPKAYPKNHIQVDHIHPGTRLSDLLTLLFIFPGEGSSASVRQPGKTSPDVRRELPDQHCRNGAIQNV